MTEFVFISLMTTAWCLGLTVASQDGMVIGFARKALVDENGDAKKEIFKPLLVCEWCMPSIHSLVGYVTHFMLFGVDLNLLVMYPVVVCAASFMTGFLWSLYLLIEKTVDLK